MEHGSTFGAILQLSLACFLSKKKIAPKVLPNFRIFYQKSTLGCSLELSPKLETKFHSKLHILKVVSATFLLVCFLILNESICQTRKNASYFTLKALLVLEKIKFQYFRFSNFMIITKCLSIKQEMHFTE